MDNLVMVQQDTPKTKPIQVGTEGSIQMHMKLRNGAVLENDGVTIAKDRRYGARIRYV